MPAFIMKRFFSSIVTLFLLISVTFLLVRLMPGSPFQNNAISQSTLEQLEDQYQLNQPIWIQYKTFLSNLVRGDLGVSYQNPSVSVNTIIARAWPNTIRLGLSAMIVSLIMGIWVGMMQATIQNHVLKGGLSFIIAFSMSIPNFAIALLLLRVFGVYFNWLPVVGLNGISYYILPVITLALYPTAMIAKMTNTSYTEAMQQECVMMARAKGLPKHIIIFRHIFKQAMIPVISMIGPTVSSLLTGSFIVESIFSISGLGMEFVRSINQRDYTMILGLVIFMGMVVIIVHTITDIICFRLDSRMEILYS